jgi:hypothetical protein
MQVYYSQETVSIPTYRFSAHPTAHLTQHPHAFFPEAGRSLRRKFVLADRSLRYSQNGIIITVIIILSSPRPTRGLCNAGRSSYTACKTNRDGHMRLLLTLNRRRRSTASPSASQA